VVIAVTVLPLGTTDSTHDGPTRAPGAKTDGRRAWALRDGLVGMLDVLARGFDPLEH
jgi:hypothetical protein